MNFSEYMKIAREKANLTQEAASKLIDVTAATIQNWENGRSKPTTELLHSISKVYNIKVEDLLKTLSSEENNDDRLEENLTFKYANLLPDNLDYSSIKDFYFTETEQEFFNTLIFHNYFTDELPHCLLQSNPVESLLKITSNSLEAIKILDKFTKLKLCTSDKYIVTNRTKNKYNLTKDIASFIFDIIYKSEKLFSVYDLNIVDFIALLKYCNIYNCPIDELRELVNKGIEDKTIEKRIDYKYTKCSTLLGIDSSYYTILEGESMDPDYLKARESYLIKLDFYNEHKDKIEGFNMPKEVPKKIVRTAIATEKAKLLIEEIDKVKSLNK